MNLAEIRAGLESCIAELEKSAANLTEQYGPRVHSMRDMSGRPLAADLYAALANAYAALAALSARKR